MSKIQERWAKEEEVLSRYIRQFGWAFRNVFTSSEIRAAERMVKKGELNFGYRQEGWTQKKYYTFRKGKGIFRQIDAEGHIEGTE